ncbi:MAG: ABC transporter permease [Rhodobiaceae bacterium]|nr:ABC transporter permease [Rhodobiaceae bacterium]MCC0049730.1 ABC transporter permease [Rhodobiaceae bacterium]
MRRNGLISLIFHTLFIIFIVAPLLAVVAVSFTGKGYLSLPTDGLSLRWFRTIWEYPGFIDAFWMSLYLGIAASTIAVAVAVPAAIAIGRYDFRGREGVMAVFLSPLMIPSVVLGVSFLRFFNQVGISGTFIGITLAHVIMVMPYAVRLVLASVTGMPRDAEQAAATLGASNWTVFRRITLPLILPGIAGGWLLAFITSFDEVTMSIFVASPETMTLPVRMYHHIAQTIDPLIAAISTLLMGATVLLLVLLDRLYGLDRVLVGKG